MPKYITRVELHGVSHNQEVYDLLHQAMEARGFSRILPTPEGKFHLPPAEYYMETTSYTGRQVVKLAKQAANTVTVPEKNTVVATVAANVFYDNLVPVAPALPASLAGRKILVFTSRKSK